MTRIAKKQNKVFAFWTVLVVLLMTSFSNSAAPYMTVAAHAAGQATQASSASQAPKAQPEVPAKKTDSFSGFTLTVLDKKTPATYTQGKIDDRNTMCFMSASDKVVGTISYSDYNAIIKKYQKVVKLPGGGTYGAPPIDGKSWEEWFADEFNTHRGLSAGSRNDAVIEATTDSKFLTEYQNEIVNLTNEERGKEGLPELIVDASLTELAQNRAQEQAIKKGHTRPDGTTVMYLGYGENLTSTPATPSGAMQNWMNSATHKQNILLKDYARIGVGCYSVGDCIYWVQIFAFDSSWYE